MYNYKNSKQNIINILTSKTKIEEKDEIPHENEFTYENGVRCWTTAIFIDIRDSSTLFTESNKDKLARFMRAFTSEIITILSQDDKHYQIGIRGDCVYGIYSSHYKKDDVRVFDYACNINTYIKMLNKVSSAYGYKSISVGIGIGSGHDLIIKAGRAGSGINDKIYIGDALVYASNLCSIANTRQYNPIAIDKLIYANVIEEHPKYKQWLHFSRDYSCKPNEFYHCNMITSDFNEWIDGGMKNV